jgi:hypothetical protein
MTDTTKIINDILDIIQDINSIEYTIIDNKVKISERDIYRNTWNIKRELKRTIQLLGFNSETKKLEMVKHKLETVKNTIESVKDVGHKIYNESKKIVQLEPEQLSIIYQCKLEIIDETIDLIDELLNDDINSNDIDFDTNKELKICFLYDLGIIDYLQNKPFSNNQIAEIIEFLTKTPIKKTPNPKWEIDAPHLST